MKELVVKELIEIDGGVNWAKVGTGALGIVGGVATAGSSSWTGAGAVVGGLAVVAGVGAVISGFEDD